jgi:hypothetical protein
MNIIDIKAWGYALKNSFHYYNYSNGAWFLFTKS